MRASPAIPASTSPRGAGVLLAMLLASLAAIAASGGVEPRDGRVAPGRLQSLGLVAGWIEVEDAHAATTSPQALEARPDRVHQVATTTALPEGGFGGSRLAAFLARLANTPPPAC